MRLSFFAEASGILVGRDGAFQNLGFLFENRPAMLSFLENSRFLSAVLRNHTICALITTPELAPRIPESLALGVCEQPRNGFAILHNHLAESGFYWKDFVTKIHPDAKIHPRAWVAEKNVTIGPRTLVGPNASILERCLIGPDVTVHAGAVLGGVGFQTARTPGAFLEMQHAGGIAIGDRVHVLHGAVIATGLFRNHTEVGPDARIGAQAFLSHGAQVGQRAFVGHGAVINGNVAIGNDAWIGPGAVVAQNLKVGCGAFVSLGSVVVRDVGPQKQVSGNFAVSHRRLLRHLATIESRNEPA